jgi:serine protease Do
VIPFAPALDDALSHLADRLRRVTVRLSMSGRRGSIGSGVVWRHDGLIVTNAHVAVGGPLTVRLDDGRELAGRVIARSESRDLAALAIDAGDLVAAGTSSPRGLVPGSLVFAMGAPFGVPDSLAAGVLHASHTRDRRGSPLLIRADIRLAPGNSGGPLSDVAGRDIGINSMIVGGLGIAIATDAVGSFVRRLTLARAA